MHVWPGSAGVAADNQWSSLRCHQRPGPADGTDAQHGVHVLRPPVLTQIIRMHGKKLRKRTRRSGTSGFAATVVGVGKRRPDPGAPRMQAAPGHRVQFAILDLFQQLGALIVEGGARDGAQVRIDAIGPREAEDGVRTLLRTRSREPQNVAKQLSVVTEPHSTVALEVVHANAELLCDFQMGREVGEMVRAARGLIGEPLGHLRYGVEGFGSDGAWRHGLQIRRAVTNAERLGTWTLAQEAQHGEKLGGGGLGKLDQPGRVLLQVSAPLAMIIVDFQVSGMFCRGPRAHLPAIAA